MRDTIARRERKRCVILLCAAIRNGVYSTPILLLTVQKMVSTGCVINCMHANNVHASFEYLLNRVKQWKMSISRKRAAQMVMLIERGVSIREVGRWLGCDHWTVCHIYHRYVETSSFTHRPRSGCPQVTTTSEDCHLVHLVQQDTFHTLAHKWLRRLILTQADVLSTSGFNNREWEVEDRQQDRCCCVIIAVVV